MCSCLTWPRPGIKLHFEIKGIPLAELRFLRLTVQRRFASCLESGKSTLGHFSANADSSIARMSKFL